MRRSAGTHVYVILLVILGLVLLAAYAARIPSDGQVLAYRVTAARATTPDQQDVVIADHAYLGHRSEPVWYNGRRNDISFRDAVIMVDNLMARGYRGQVTVAVADDDLPLLIVEMPGYSATRAQQALCRIAKLLVRSGALDGRQGIEVQCEEAGSDGEGRFVNVCTRLEQARGLMCGSVSQTAFLRANTIAQN